jgi:hypothetical protein
MQGEDGGAGGDRDQEGHDPTSLDGSGSGSEHNGTGRSNGAADLAVEAFDAEEGSSGEDEGEEGDILTVRRRDVLCNVAAIEAEAARLRYSVGSALLRFLFIRAICEWCTARFVRAD